jgi:hypothetical protein
VTSKYGKSNSRIGPKCWLATTPAAPILIDGVERNSLPKNLRDFIGANRFAQVPNLYVHVVSVTTISGHTLSRGVDWLKSDSARSTRINNNFSQRTPNEEGAQTGRNLFAFHEHTKGIVRHLQQI